MAAKHRSHRHGAQGVLDTASKATLENEFGTSVDDEVVAKILEGGSVQTTEVSRSSSGQGSVVSG